MNIFKTIGLTFRNLFSQLNETKKKSILSNPPQGLIDQYKKAKERELAEESSADEEFLEERFRERLRRMRFLAGLIDPAEENSARTANRRFFSEVVEEEYKRLRREPKRMNYIRGHAEDKAELMVKNDEMAIAMANAMEAHHRELANEKKEFEAAWKAYLEKNVKEQEPTADDFAEFLVKNKYLAKDLLDELMVAAIFVDDELKNFRDFRAELHRVKSLGAS